MTYDLQRGEPVIKPYWSLPAPQDAAGNLPPREALLDEMEALLIDSVRLRMIADVPLGILLSGGVDSSLITAAAARISAQPVKTFTITFPGGGRYDEAPHAQIVARHFGTEHCELPLPEGDLRVLRTIAAHLDEPLGDPSILPSYLVSELTRRHVTVALGGDGGDELFGGYSWYRTALNAMHQARNLPTWLRQAASAGVGVLPPGTKGRNYIRSTADDLQHFMITNSLVFDASMRQKLYVEPVRRGLGADLEGPERYKQQLWPQTGDDVYAMSVLDVRSFLQDDIMVKVDRASMAFALELRAPWLDVRMIEFALRETPSIYKLDAQNDRVLQRQLARRMLPAELNLNRKQGFVMPIHAWMAGAWGEETLQVVADGAARQWLNSSYVTDLMRGQQQGRTNGVRLFTCLMFGLWLDNLWRV
jgi:asparagine synthase (glutamine-hydrolysing)